MDGAQVLSPSSGRKYLPRKPSMTHPLSREIPIEPAHAALLFVDVQKYNSTCGGAADAHLSAAEKQERFAYFFRNLQSTALPNMVRLQQACRRAGIEVTYTVIE